MLTKLSSLSPLLLRDLAGEIALGAREPVIRKLLGNDRASWVMGIIGNLQKNGWTFPLLSEALLGMAAVAEVRPELDECLELVITNPFEGDSPARDTRAVMLSLFEQAKNDLLIAGYALHKSTSLLQPLAEKMQLYPRLKVRFFLDLQKPQGWHKTDINDYISQFSKEFQEKYWPWKPFPEIWLDIRKWREIGNENHSLHAKCIVADHAHSFITSANLTEAAQYRNIEIGVLIRSTLISRHLIEFFEQLSITDSFRRLVEV